MIDSCDGIILFGVTSVFHNKEIMTMEAMSWSFAFGLLEAHVKAGNTHEAVHDLCFSLIHDERNTARVASLLARNEHATAPLIATVLASNELPREARIMLTHYCLA